MYIKGTDIEVGVTRVSYDPLYPYAMCTIRLGIKKKYLKRSSLKPISIRYIKIPYVCLSKFPSIKYNRLMYDAALLPSDPSIEPLFQKSSPLTEGKYEEAPLPHAKLYEIVPTTIDGKKYYMHLLKPLNPTLAGVGKSRSFSVFGIPLSVTFIRMFQMRITSPRISNCSYYIIRSIIIAFIIPNI